MGGAWVRAREVVKVVAKVDVKVVKVVVNKHVNPCVAMPVEEVVEQHAKRPAVVIVEAPVVLPVV